MAFILFVAPLIAVFYSWRGRGPGPKTQIFCWAFTLVFVGGVLLPMVNPDCETTQFITCKGAGPIVQALAVMGTYLGFACILIVPIFLYAWMLGVALWSLFNFFSPKRGESKIKTRPKAKP